MRAIETAAKKALAGELGQEKVIADHAKGCAGLLCARIEKEDTILCPLAERVLPENVRGGILQAYSAAEAKTPGMEERYRQMVEKYERLRAA